MPSLPLSLTLPDICGWLETPGDKVGSRYRRWAKRWVEPEYTIQPAGVGRIVLLSAGDLYALRCAITHSGTDDISEQHAQETLTKFDFVEPANGVTFQSNRFNDRLQLQIDLFCSDLCDAVDKWAVATAADEAIQERAGKLIRLAIPDYLVGAR